MTIMDTAAGDQVLKNISELIFSLIRQGDIACRYGGEEFVIISPGLEIHKAQNRAEEIRVAINKMVTEWENAIGFMYPFPQG